MTLDKLIRELQKLQAANWGRAKIAVDVESFDDGNGTWQICDVRAVDASYVRQVDGDGFGIENKDGTERTKACVVLKG